MENKNIEEPIRFTVQNKEGVQKITGLENEEINMEIGLIRVKVDKGKCFADILQKLYVNGNEIDWRDFFSVINLPPHMYDFPMRNTFIKNIKDFDFKLKNNSKIDVVLFPRQEFKKIDIRKEMKKIKYICNNHNDKT